MYHRFVRSKKPDSHSVPENEKQDSPVNLGLAAYTRSRPTLEDIMLYQSHRLTPISSALLSKAGPIKSNEIMVDDMAEVDQSSSPGLSQYCGIDFDNISPPADMNFDDELDEEFFASLAIPKVLVPPTEPGQEQQQAKSPPPSYSNLVFDFPSSINLEKNQTNRQENITEKEPTNNLTQTPKQQKKHKKDGRKKKEKKKKVEQESQEVKKMEETKAAKETEKAKETEEAKETKEQKKKKRKKKRKEESKNKDQKDSTDYTTTSCDNTKHDIPILDHGTITVDRNPYPVWSSKYSHYSTNMCGTSDKADTSQTPASGIPSTATDKSPAKLLWKKSVDNKTAVSSKLPDPSSSDEFEAVYFQYNDITNVLTPTLELPKPPQKERGDLIKEVSQEVRNYFKDPTVDSTAGIGTKKSYHQLTCPQSANPQQQQKRDIQSIINKYSRQNQDGLVYCPKAPRAPRETSQDSSTLVNNTNTPVKKFGRIIHCNPTVQITSTFKPSPPNNTTNPHPPASCLTSSNTLHQSPAKDENSPARQPHPPSSKPQPSAASQCPSTSGPHSATVQQQHQPTSRPRPPTARQGPLNFKPQPPTASQYLLTSRPPPSAACPRPPTAHQRPPTARQRPPTSRPRPPTAHQCSPTSKQRPPTAKPQPQSSSHHPPGAKMVLLQSQKSDYHLIEDESAQLPQLSPSQTESEEPLTNFSLKPNPPSMPQQLNREFYRAKIARRLKKVQPGGRVLEHRGHKF